MDAKIKRRWGIVIRAGVALLLIVFLISHVRAELLMQSVRKILFPYLLLSLFFQYTSILLGSFNLYILFRPFLEVNFSRFCSSYFKAFTAGLLMPGQFGDVSIVLFLNSKELNYSRTFSVYMWDKYITLVFYLGIVFIFISEIMEYPKWVPIAVMIGAGCLLFSLIYMITRLGLFAASGGWTGRIVRFFHNSAAEIMSYARLHPLRLLMNGGLTCFKLFFVMLCYHFILAALGYDLSVVSVGISSIASSVVAYLPISLHGVGTVEATAMWVFGRLNVSSADVLSGFLLLRLSVYALALFVFTLVVVKEGKNVLKNGAGY